MTSPCTRLTSSVNARSSPSATRPIKSSSEMTIGSGADSRSGLTCVPPFLPPAGSRVPGFLTNSEQLGLDPGIGLVGSQAQTILGPGQVVEAHLLVDVTQVLVDDRIIGELDGALELDAGIGEPALTVVGPAQ